MVESLRTPYLYVSRYHHILILFELNVITFKQCMQAFFETLKNAPYLSSGSLMKIFTFIPHFISIAKQKLKL